jgi:hypothetical protein
MPVMKTEINGRGVRRTDHTTPIYPQKLGLKLADQRRSYGSYISLADCKSRSLFLLFMNKAR